MAATVLSIRAFIALRLGRTSCAWRWFQLTFAPQCVLQSCHEGRNSVQVLTMMFSGCCHHSQSSENCTMTPCRYGEPQPGKVVLPPNLACPYCKAAPAAKTLHRHNREVRSP